MNQTLAQASLQVALTQNGVSEQPKGSNGGPQVSQYLRSIGLGPGYAWCMAFVYWCVNKAAQDLQVPNPLVKTGGVLHQYNTTKLRKLPKTSIGIKAGDIFIMDFGKGLGHTGFVIKIEKGLVHTIEGNTNDDGSREGYEVAIRTRPLSSFKAFIQLN
jgi:CHAP domain